MFVTNIDYEPNNLFHNNGDETFDDVTVRTNLGSVAMLFSAFGTKFIDFDNDGNMDIVVLNGHVLDNIQLFREGVAYAERPFLLQNVGGKFQEVGAAHGKAFTKAYVGRALATGDFNNDGAIDMLWVTNGGPPVLLRNDGGNRNSWIGFQLKGTASNRDAIGAVVTVTGRWSVAQVIVLRMIPACCLGLDRSKRWTRSKSAGQAEPSLLYRTCGPVSMSRSPSQIAALARNRRNATR